MTTIPSLFETVVATGDHTTLPQPEVPYHVLAEEGFFDHKHTEIGNVLLRRTRPPENLPKLGITGGMFTWQGGKVPAHIFGQAYSFFRRIYEKYHSEAEVLITKNDEGSFRLFVPYQRASHAGVKSVYEPTHVTRGWLVVGTLHSHCDFSAFHSGTDSGDASDMDGVHFTIGKVLHPVPEIVAMVAMSGKEFHYNTVTDIADVDFYSATAPEWWDIFVFAGGRKAPETKPVGLISLTQEHWDEFLGRPLVKPKTITNALTTPKWQQHQSSGYRYGGPRTWGGYPVRERDWDTTDWKDWGKPKKKRPVVSQTLLDQALDLAEELGCFSDDDWDSTSTSEIDDPDYWKGFFINRIDNIKTVLALLESESKPKSKRKAMR